MLASQILRIAYHRRKSFEWLIHEFLKGNIIFNHPQSGYNSEQNISNYRIYTCVIIIHMNSGGM